MQQISMRRLVRILMIFISACVYAQENLPEDSLQIPVAHIQQQKWRHALDMEFRPAWVFTSDPFLKGDNEAQKAIRNTWSAHLEYALAYPTTSPGGRIYPDTWQGIGVSHFDFGNKRELGSPTAVYFFQRSKLAQLTPGISLFYEWNFGLSFGWSPYDYYTNTANITIGSRTNAFMNAGFFIKWRLLPQTYLITGADVSHFSNGNTSFPNAGLNIAGIKTGLICEFGTPDSRQDSIRHLARPPFNRHFSYDVVAFGSHRKKAIPFQDGKIASPETYPVWGVYAAAMYNLNYRLRTGISSDFVYDKSSDAYTELPKPGTQQRFYRSEDSHQKALGFSARIEYVMPVFDIGFGFGANVFYKGKDMKGTYQSLALKVKATRNAFVHIGYNLKNFREPNYLMLGVGYRFHNRMPKLVK
ncbi:hypothetical protein [Daejeonia sp. YH14]|uniref:hypothetical protein n=1 Tax=Daejeonia sp. YH14 TaxID=3439042 RepID=UPI003F496241